MLPPTPPKILVLVPPCLHFMSTVKFTVPEGLLPGRSHRDSRESREISFLFITSRCLDVVEALGIARGGAEIGSEEGKL